MPEDTIGFGPWARDLVDDEVFSVLHSELEGRLKMYFPGLERLKVDQVSHTVSFVGVFPLPRTTVDIAWVTMRELRLYDLIGRLLLTGKRFEEVRNKR